MIHLGVEDRPDLHISWRQDNQGQWSLRYNHNEGENLTLKFDFFTHFRTLINGDQINLTGSDAALLSAYNQLVDVVTWFRANNRSRNVFRVTEHHNWVVEGF